MVIRPTEEDLWRDLDEALVCAMDDPAWSLQLAIWIVEDSDGYPDVRAAAEALIFDYFGDLAPWDLGI